MTSNVFGVSIIDVLDYTNTTTKKTFRGLSGWDNNTSGYVDFGSGHYGGDTTAITSITYSCATGVFAVNSSFALYGVK